MKIKTIVNKDFKKRKLSNLEYAKLFGVTRDAIQKWKTGDTKPHIAVQWLMNLSTSEIIKLKTEKLYIDKAGE